MKYYSGESIELGDIVEFDIAPGAFVRAKVVMLGSDGSHLEIEPEYLSGIKEINLVKQDMIVAEYLNEKGETKGNYCPTTVLNVELIEKRGADENS